MLCMDISKVFYAAQNRPGAISLMPGECAGPKRIPIVDIHEEGYIDKVCMCIYFYIISISRTIVSTADAYDYS